MVSSINPVLILYYCCQTVFGLSDIMKGKAEVISV